MKYGKLIISLTFICSFVSYELTAQHIEINVMTFNVRYDNKGDGVNVWQSRRDYAAGLILFHDADIVGTQEVLHNQLEDFLTRMPQYSYIGVGRLDGVDKGEYSAIFYKTDKFDVLNSGTFWLGEDIKAVGKKGWDAACERIVTWGVFKEKKTGKEFCVLNTHFDHVGEIARFQSAKLLLEKVKELSGGLPVIVCGDFNAEPSSTVIKTITDKTNPDHLTDSREIAELIYGPMNTFHDFGRLPFNQRNLIDYIFIKGSTIKVKKLGVLTDTHDGVYLSDHFPVLATIIID